MTNIEKYKLILSELALGKKQNEIILSCKCSYGTITRAKAWQKELVDFVVPNVASESSSSESSSSESSSSKSSSSDVVVSENSSKKGPKIEILEFDYNSRFLSWMGSVLKIEKYYGLSKEVLKSKIIEKISKL